MVQEIRKVLVFDTAPDDFTYNVLKSSLTTLDYVDSRKLATTFESLRAELKKNYDALFYSHRSDEEWKELREILKEDDVDVFLVVIAEDRKKFENDSRIQDVLLRSEVTSAVIERILRKVPLHNGVAVINCLNSLISLGERQLAATNEMRDALVGLQKMLVKSESLPSRKAMFIRAMLISLLPLITFLANYLYGKS